jgi:hypothetical protein
VPSKLLSIMWRKKNLLVLSVQYKGGGDLAIAIK